MKKSLVKRKIERLVFPITTFRKNWKSSRHLEKMVIQTGEKTKFNLFYSIYEEHGRRIFSVARISRVLWSRPSNSLADVLKAVEKAAADAGCKTVKVTTGLRDIRIQQFLCKRGYAPEFFDSTHFLIVKEIG